MAWTGLFRPLLMESDAHLHELKRDSATSSELHSNQKALAVSWILTVLCSFMVILRFHVRLRITKKTFSDDWIILFALVCQYLDQIFFTLSVKCSMDPPPEGLPFNPETIKWQIAEILPSTTCALAVRISAAILLARIFKTVLWLRVFLIVMSILMVLVCIPDFVLLFLTKKPFAGLWDPRIPSVILVPIKPQMNISFLLGGLYAFCDLTYVLFPAVIIWKLHMSPRRRLALCFVVVVSWFTGAAAVLKAVLTLTHALKVPFNEPLMWIAIEQCLSISLGCIPPLLPLLKTEQPIIQKVASIMDAMACGFISRKDNSGSRWGSRRRNGSGANAGGQFPTIGSMRVRPIPRDDMGLTQMTDEEHIVATDEVEHELKYIESHNASGKSSNGTVA